jgi:MFS transporter, UMF1 family
MTVAAPAPAAPARRPLASWIVYDMAAHGYTLMVSGVAYPVYFATVVAAGRGNTDMLWSIALGLPLVVAGVLGPLIGALADATGRRRALLAAATLACSAATALLVFVGAGDVALGVILFAVAHLAHLLATSLYNSYLPLIAAPDRLARISGIAWGLSYLGSVAVFVLCLPFTRDGLAPANVSQFTGTFLFAGAFLAILGLPAVIGLPQFARQYAADGEPGPYRRIASTIRGWRRDRNVPKLLLAYYLVNDGVVTAVFFTALTFRKTYGMSVQEILGLSLVLQLVAIPATIFFGWLGGRWSQRGALNVAIVLWIAVLMLMATADGLNGAIGVTVSLGVVLGSTQSLFRSLFAAFVPVDRASEYFGFHALVGRASAALGPLSFGLVSALTGSQRIAMASLAAFFIAGGVVLAFVRTPRLVEPGRRRS